MNTLFIGQKVIRLDQTDSTNSYLLRLLGQEKLPEGVVVITQKQDWGRGQRGAIWDSEPNKNLTLSILLEPTFLKPEEQFQLNKAVSLGVMEFVVATLVSSLSKSSSKERAFIRSPLLFSRRDSFLKGEGRAEVKIKWPNDIYIGNKKAAGVLIENSVSGSQLQHSIIGIGININQERFSATLPNPVSLKLITDKEFDLEECLSQLCSCIEKRYLQLRPHTGFLSTEAGDVDAEYLKNIYHFDEWENYNYKGEILKAKITGVTKEGRLIMETDNGKTLECDFKEVEFC